MLSGKSNEQAAKCRQEGSELQAESKWFEAQVSYNKSLCNAEMGSLEAAMAFDCRSRVYFEVGQFEKCLNNIEAAKEHGYPKDLINELEDREENCKKLIANQNVNLADDISSFFKLSHPHHSKIPFIVDCLEIHKSEQFGRYVTTSKDLEPGDIIAIEESHFNFICPTAIYTNCFNCLNPNMLDLMPSSSNGMRDLSHKIIT